MVHVSINKYYGYCGQYFIYKKKYKNDFRSGIKKKKKKERMILDQYINILYRIEGKNWQRKLAAIVYYY